MGENTKLEVTRFLFTYFLSNNSDISLVERVGCARQERLVMLD